EEEKREAFRNASKESKKEWGEAGKGEAAGPGAGAVPGPGGATKGGGPGGAGKAGGPAKAKAKRKKGGRGGGNPIFQKIAPEDRQKLFRGTDEEKAAILKKAGLPEAEIQPMLDRMKNFGGGGGGGFGGRGGGGGGGRGRSGGGPS